jgi:telomerase Cajal body protein 1
MRLIVVDFILFPPFFLFHWAFSDQPIHMYDAYSGAVRASYRPFNALDEIEAPAVVHFTSDGQKILASGFQTDRTIHLFDTAAPGRRSTILRLGKTRRSSDGQKGLVSALSSCSSDRNVLAVGTYAPGSIYLYDHRIGELASGIILNGLCVVGHGRGHAKKKRRRNVAGETDIDAEDANWISAAKVKWFHSRAQGGVTQLMFSPSQDREMILYSASRRSNAILAWDLRMLSGDPDYQSNPVQGLASYETRNETNQRLEFEIGDDNVLYVGGQDKCVRVYDIVSGKLTGKIEGLDDSANGVSFACVQGKAFLAVATGSRRFLSDDDLLADDEHGASHVQEDSPPGSLSLYSLAIDGPLG